MPRCQLLVVKKLLNSLIQSLIPGPEIRGTSEPPSIIMETQRGNHNRSDTHCVLGSWRAALRFWEKGYRQRADSPWGRWHINGMDVRHAPGQYYLHYEMSDIEYFALSLRWIQADILSTRLRSLLLSFNSSRDIEHVLLKRVQYNFEMKLYRQNGSVSGLCLTDTQVMFQKILSPVNEESITWCSLKCCEKLYQVFHHSWQSHTSL